MRRSVAIEEQQRLSELERGMDWIELDCRLEQLCGASNVRVFEIRARRRAWELQGLVEQADGDKQPSSVCCPCLSPDGRQLVGLQQEGGNVAAH